MIKRIQIENFKSFGKVDLEPHPRVNLLIGPNSSGKSNFLEALQFGSPTRSNPDLEFLWSQLYLKINKVEKYKHIIIKLDIESKFDTENLKDHSFVTVFDSIELSVGFHQLTINFLSGDDRLEYFLWTKEKGFSSSTRPQWEASFLLSVFNERLPNSIRLYKPEIVRLLQDQPSRQFKRLSTNMVELSILVNSLQNEYPSNYHDLISDLEQFTKEFNLIKTPAAEEDGHITLRFFNNLNQSFSAKDVSEGILIFTALLAILHQPDPPKVILLEEPENGIHPRRIIEIYRLIWKLAEEKDVQFFITTHSPILLNQFSENPECVWVFDKEEGITKIQNLQNDILEPRRKKLVEMGIEEPSDLTDDLGENWMLGLLDGVPPSILPEDY